MAPLEWGSLVKVFESRVPIDSLGHFSYSVIEIMREDSLGPFEQLVLTAILVLSEDAYGVSVHARVQELARPRKISLGAIYVTLDRLEYRGLVSSRLGAPTQERGGRAKRCYRVESAGERALRRSAVVAKRVWDTLAADGAWRTS
jgi:PadR family transcriptional regulator